MTPPEPDPLGDLTSLATTARLSACLRLNQQADTLVQIGELIQLVLPESEPADNARRFFDAIQTRFNTLHMLLGAETRALQAQYTGPASERYLIKAGEAADVADAMQQLLIRVTHWHGRLASLRKEANNQQFMLNRAAHDIVTIYRMWSLVGPLDEDLLADQIEVYTRAARDIMQRMNEALEGARTTVNDMANG